MLAQCGALSLSTGSAGVEISSSSFFSKGFDWSLSVYPVHEDILHSKAIRCGFVLSLGGYLGLEGPESGVLRRLSAMHWASSDHSGLLLPPVSLL